VYDPTPMRAYSIHNMLSVMPFGGYGETDEATGATTGLAAAVQNLAKNLGIPPATLEEMTGKALQATEHYSERARTGFPAGGKPGKPGGDRGEGQGAVVELNASRMRSAPTHDHVPGRYGLLPSRGLNYKAASQPCPVHRRSASQARSGYVKCIIADAIRSYT